MSVQFGLLRSVLIASLTDHAIRMGALATATARRCLAKGRQILDSRCHLRGLGCDDHGGCCHPDVALLVGRIHSGTLVRKRVQASRSQKETPAVASADRSWFTGPCKSPSRSPRQHVAPCRNLPPHTLRIAGLTSGSFRSTGCFATMDRWRGFCCSAPCSERSSRMADLERESGLKRFGAVPNAAGTLSRLASARARAAGIDVAPLMVKAGVTGQQVEDDSVWLTVQGQIRFVELVANALQDDFLGFHLAESFDVREMGLLYYVAASSESLGEALRRLERYSTIGNEGVALRVREGDDLAVTFHYVGVARLSDRHQIEVFSHLAGPPLPAADKSSSPTEPRELLSSSQRGASRIGQVPGLPCRLWRQYG